MATKEELRWAEYDAVCKRLLSEKSVLAKILKECVHEFETCTTDEIMAKYIEDVSQTEGKVTYDIRFNAKTPISGEQIGLIINIEAQDNYEPGYRIIRRGIYYCSRMISAQHGTVFTKSDYNKIKKVYSIWICTNPASSKQNTISQYEIKETNILGNGSENVSDYDLATVILIRLGKQPNECGNEIIDFLTTLLNSYISEKEKTTVLHDRYNVELTDTLMKGVDKMCDLGRGVYYEGVEAGIEQGIEQGKTAERDKMIGNYLETGATLEDAFKIFKITDIEEQARLREALNLS